MMSATVDLNGAECKMLAGYLALYQAKPGGAEFPELLDLESLKGGPADLDRLNASETDAASAVASLDAGGPVTCEQLMSMIRMVEDLPRFFFDYGMPDIKRLQIAHGFLDVLRAKCPNA